MAKGPVVVVLGPPASGKGTQCKRAAAAFGLRHISAGDTIRAEAARGTELGDQVKQYMDSGDFVPDELMIGIIRAQLAESGSQRGCLLDGFPRTVVQAEAMASAVDCFVLLRVLDDVVVGRALGRRMDPNTGAIYHLEFAPPPLDVLSCLEQRSSDMSEAIVRRRLEVYHSQISGIVACFKDKVSEIDGGRSIEDVFSSVTQVVRSAIDDQDDWGDEDVPSDSAFEASPAFSLSVGIACAVEAEGGAAMAVVSIDVPDGQDRPPLDVCCVVDTSGSMGADATLEVDGMVRSNGLSVLDIVKHAVKAVMFVLKDGDRLSVVSFGDESQVIAGLTSMSESGRLQVIVALESLRPSGQTNLWGGIYAGMESLRIPMEASGSSHRQQALLLLTDGQPNVIPRPEFSHVAELCEYKDTHPGFSFQLSTFGFGYDVDSALLSSLAAEGHGTYAFVPDAVILGTVFVDKVANLLSTRLQHSTLHLSPVQGASFDGPVLGGLAATEASWGRVVALGPLQLGQSREVAVPLQVPGGSAPYLEAVLTYSLGGVAARVAAAGSSREASDRSALGALRSEAVTVGLAAIADADAGRGEKASEAVAALADRLAAAPEHLASHLSGLKADVSGRMTKALQGEDRFKRWGKHYLRALMRAHQLQTCTNFMDPGLQAYGGTLFRTIRREGDEAFRSLPPPRAAKDETGIPCEQCGMSIPFANFAEHFDTCGRVPVRQQAGQAPAAPVIAEPDMNDYYAGGGGG